MQSLVHAPPDDTDEGDHEFVALLYALRNTYMFTSSGVFSACAKFAFTAPPESKPIFVFAGMTPAAVVVSVALSTIVSVAPRRAPARPALSRPAFWLNPMQKSIAPKVKKTMTGRMSAASTRLLPR